MASYALISVQASITDIADRVRLLCSTLLLMQILSLVLALSLPSYGVSVGVHEGEWQGIFTHKNILGSFSALSIAIFIGGMQFNLQYRSSAGILISLILIINSGSTTSLTTSILIISIYTLLKLKPLLAISIRNKNLLITLLLLSNPICVAISVFSPSLILLSKDSSFSGRDAIWMATLNEISKSPILGHGLSQFSYFFFGSSVTELRRLGDFATSSHNGFIDLLFSLGIIGTSLFILSIFRTFNNSPPTYFSIKIITITCLIIINTFETRLISLNIYFVAFLFISKLSNIDLNYKKV
ncbi:O-antigen ligase family protein [Pseudomonas sp. PDM19]|uniref:O-antigen ligase family protein n=1 Tax=Pseudomonas sp. PDM19 TaxID=2769272 RepID=UPI00177EB23D|nr:O-antigen ligase family protein [Pseudomonas sp. PDM19]MBD9632588.1 O-antigen ligase family protein [Pseudomonas sp. PDM19]